MVQYFGILNLTPDSFSDGGQFLKASEQASERVSECQKDIIDVDKAVTETKKLFEVGADFVDIGGQSTRPGGAEIGWEEEWRRVEGVLKALKDNDSNDDNDVNANNRITNSPLWLRGDAEGRGDMGNFHRLSLDTKHPQTARKFLDMGGRILNDVSGMQDPGMREIAPEFDLIIVNHFPGETIDEVHEQEISSVYQVLDQLYERKQQLISAGCDADSIVLDPGIGFGKTMECNWKLVEFASYMEEERIMIGASRKRFIEKVSEFSSQRESELSEKDLEDLAKGRFSSEANAVVERMALESGAEFIRTHEMK